MIPPRVLCWAVCLNGFFLLFGGPAIILVGADACELRPEDNGQCNPLEHLLSKPLRPNFCYCTDKKRTWNGGTWCQFTNNCHNGACWDEACQCTCDGGGCGSKFPGAGACFKGIAACPPCSPGEVRYNCGCSGANGDDCQPGSCYSCPAMTYSSTGADRECKPCKRCAELVGIVAPFTVQPCTPSTDAVFAPCPDGRLCTGEGLWPCPLLEHTRPCPVDHYCTGSAATRCIAANQQQCPRTGMSAPETWCLPGSYRSGGTCVLCDKGTYKSGGPPPASANAPCAPCDAGSYAAAEGATACTACPPGKFGGAAAARSACENCLAGMYQSASGATACLACAAGRIAPLGGATACTACAAGNFSVAGETPDKDACAQCAAGTYAGPGSTACTNCTSGFTSLRGAAGSPADCVRCKPGLYIDDAKACAACLSSRYYCTGDGELRPRVGVQVGVHYVANFRVNASQDYELLPCTPCARPPLEYALENCTVGHNYVCRPCAVGVKLEQYVQTPCGNFSDTVFGNCTLALGDMDPGQRCNPCPPGSTRSSAPQQGCVLCPADTYKAGAGDGPCVPCAGGSISGGGASRCTVMCGGASGAFAFDGVTCVESANVAVVPRRVVLGVLGAAASAAACPRRIALGAPLLYDDSRQLVVQNVGGGSGLVWAMSASSSECWRLAGDASTGGESRDGVSLGARFGTIVGLARAGAQPWFLLTEAGGSGRGRGVLRALSYDAASGLLTASTPALRLVTPDGASLPPDAEGPKAPVGVAAAYSVPTGTHFLVADEAAHCVWLLASPAPSASGVVSATIYAIVWRGGQQATAGDPAAAFVLPNGARLGSAPERGNEFRLAAPTAVAALSDPEALAQLLQAELGGLMALGFVLDARGVWAFDAMTRRPTQTPADLMYVCGCGTVNAAAAMAAQPQHGTVQCTDLSVMASGIRGLSVGRTGGGPALFLSYAAADGGSGVLVAGLRQAPATMRVRLLGAASSAAAALSGGAAPMWWTADGGRFFVAEEEFAVGALTAAFLAAEAMTTTTTTTRQLQCVCDAGLYCDAARQQCVPAPAGTYAPMWSSRPLPCPEETVSGGPEGRNRSWCRPCEYSAQYTTFAPGALVCERLCGRDQFYSSGDGCIDRCDWAGKGQYERLPLVSAAASRSSKPPGACAVCPPGTAATGAGKGVAQGCALCALGEHGGGGNNGACAPCPGASGTFFRGATACTSFVAADGGGGSSIPCFEDGYAGAAAVSACANASRELAWRTTPPLSAAAAAAALTITSMAATSEGVLWGGVLEGLRPWRVLPEEDPTGVRRVDYDAAPQPQPSQQPPLFELVEIMDGGRLLFAAERGGTCVWLVNQTTSPQQRTATVWAGVCGTAGDMNGAAATGLARLGHIHALALVHVENYTPVLLISTQFNGCAAVRSVSVYDGSVSTLVSSDVQRLPTVLVQECVAAPYLLAVARGSDEVLYSTQGGVKVWRLHALRPSASTGASFAPPPYITLPQAKRVLAMCARGLLDAPHGALALLTADGNLSVRTYGAPTMVHMPLLSDSNATLLLSYAVMACAGRRVWWADSRDGGRAVRTVGLSALLARATSAVARGCVGGYVPVLLPSSSSSSSTVCAQVGVGQYTTIRLRAAAAGGVMIAEEAVAECRPGTYGRRAGAGSHQDCVPCDVGLIALRGSAGCDACPADRPNAMGDQCMGACPLGHYKAASLAACLPCPAGTAAPLGARGIQECVACAAGTFADATTGGRCAPCPAGTTSLAGSFRCVRICTVGTCATDGETCVSMVNHWEIVTPIWVPTLGTTMSAVTVGDGGHVFYTNGETLMYVFDDCPARVTLADEAFHACELEGVNLLALTPPASKRGFASLAIAHGFALDDHDVSVEGRATTTTKRRTRFLYAASYLTHSVYRFPLLFATDGYGTVDAEATTVLLSGVRAHILELSSGEGSSGDAARAAYDAYFVQPGSAPGYEYADGSGCDGWRLIGQAGAPGKGGKQGRFDAGPLLNVPVELELSADDRQLLISDLANHRVCAADLAAQTVRTLVGTGGACWRFGASSPATCANVGAAAGCAYGGSSTACASVSQPMGVGLSADGSRLYMAAHQVNRVVTLANPLSATPGALQPYCAINYNTDVGGGAALQETCSRDSCMLNRPFDVLATQEGMLYVAVTNGITLINTQTLACRQVAGAYWVFDKAVSGAWRDGALEADSVEPTSRLNQPLRMAVDNARGILYVADFTVGALRRVLVDGKCRCAEGSLFVPSALACYNPTPAWDTGLVLVSCPPGQFALQDQRAGQGGVCRPCAEAEAMGVAAVACLLMQATSSAAVDANGGGGDDAVLQEMRAQAGKGASFAQVSMRPEPLGGVAADWYYNGRPADGSVGWSDGFRPDSLVRYQLGRAPGRAPWGGEFVTLTYHLASKLWGLEARTLLQPVRVLPGLWQACTTVAITATGDADATVQCDCSAVPGSYFAEADGTPGGGGGAAARWHELRLQASRQGGRILGAGRGRGGAVLADFARGVTEHAAMYSDSLLSSLTRVKATTRFMILGTDSARAAATGMCAWGGGQGPCFPTIAEYGPLNLSLATLARLPKQRLQYVPARHGGATWPALTNVLCAAGWPAHYRCPPGYTWVGLNTSALAEGQLLESTSLARGQIACLSCLPGSFSSNAKDGAYTCTLCDFGHFAAGVASTACAPCPAGTYANGTGASRCEACPPNHFTSEAASGADECSPCAPGTGNCTDCVPGQYQDQAAQGICRPCDPGSFSNSSNQSVCHPCPPNTYQNRGQQARCRQCPPTQYTPPHSGSGAWGGATACTDCAAAECPFIIDGVCGRGCGVNYFWDEEAALMGLLSSLEEDTTAEATNISSSISSSSSSSSSGSSVSRFCRRCAPGTLSARLTCATSISACWTDAPGLYVAQRRWPDGTGDVIGKCPAGQGPNANLDGCVPCAAGLYSTEGSGCLPCAAGGYSSAAGSTGCARCAAGKYTPPLSSAYLCATARYVVRGWCNPQGRTVCDDCIPGTFAAREGLVGCAQCVTGTYATGFGTVACTLCDAGKFSGTSRNGSATPCTQECAAAAGFFSGAGASTCVYCAGGIVEAASSGCVGCGLGRYEVEVAGLRQCADCPAGLVQLVTAFATGVDACVPCPEPTIHFAVYSSPRELRGRYCVPTYLGHVALLLENGGAIAQMPCPAGQFRGNGSLSCAPCAGGQWSAPGSAACAPCQRGTYRSADAWMQQDGSECVPCPPGSIAAETGATWCVGCPPGQVPTDGGTRCVSCPPNTYSADATLGCAACMDGEVAPPGATACAPCPDWTTLITPQFAAAARMPPVPPEGACSVCPPGYYMGTLLLEGSTLRVVYQCRACPPGRHNTRSNATSIAACIPCAVAAYVPNRQGGAASMCVQCAPGTASQDGVRCTACRPGNFSSQGLVCARCPPGSYTADEGQTQCLPCPVGTYSAVHGVVACTPCPPGTFNNITAYGVTGCQRCEPDRFSNGTGATRCAPRRTACAPGNYVVVRNEQPTEDNGCAFCAPCASDEYTASTLTESWSALSFVAGGAGAASASELIGPESCPGNTTAPGFRCIPNTWPAGKYITPATLQQLTAGGGGSSSSSNTNALFMSALSCTDLASFAAAAPGINRTAADAAMERMDYTVGPTFECYIGCKYGLDVNAARQYAHAYPDERGGLEAPERNIFYPSVAKLFASTLCTACSTAPCTRLGRYRPTVATTAGTAACGPPCRLNPTLCVEKEADGTATFFNDGCIAVCDPPPAHAITTGGSAVTGGRQCPWVCQGPASQYSPGYHLRDDGTGCEWCGDMRLCDATHVHVPPFMCFPYSRTADVCKPCPPVEGGIPSGWLLLDDANASAGGRCTYDCAWGYYSVDEARSGCRPCTFLNNVSCAIGMYRDTAACYATRQAPVCAPCVAPADVQTNAGALRVTYRSPGVPGRNDSCLALCNVGFHTVVRSSLTSEVYTYVLSTGGGAAGNISVGDLACVLCKFTDTLPCHGACPPTFYRDRRIPLDTTPGACKPCTTNADCAVGEYAPLCLGNSTADVGCQPCARSRLLQYDAATDAHIVARVFVPYSALASQAAQNGLIRSDVADGRACPTACTVNRVLDPADRVTCVRCVDYIKGQGCEAEETRVTTTTPGGYAPQQPRACAFRNAHWNATPGPIWWTAPQYTPPFLRGLLGSGGVYTRAGVCWACPTGLGTPDAARDLCQLMPGFGLVGQGIVVERTPIPALGDDLAIVLEEPRPSIPVELLPAAAGWAINNRRRLLTVNATAAALAAAAEVGRGKGRALLQNEEGAAAAAAAAEASGYGECLIGTYNTGRGSVCNACPPGTTTYGRGSMSVEHCVCLFGYYNASQTAWGGCVPCPAETYDRRITWGAPDPFPAGSSADAVRAGSCWPCPATETTFGADAQSSCACRAGQVRRASTSDSAVAPAASAAASPRNSSLRGKICTPCPAGFFCTPCFQGQPGCPNSLVWATPCMANGVSPVGSASLANCTCGSNQTRLLRGGPDATLEALLAPTLVRPTNAGMYCMDPPPNSVYDAELLRLGCKRGWTARYYPQQQPPQLQGCSLCGRGSYAEADPALTMAPLKCLPCPIGNYSDRTDAIGGCTPCGEGLTTAVRGSTSSNNCTCPAGMGRDRATQKCVGCTLYEYQAADGKACVRCPDINMLTMGNALSVEACLCGPGFAKSVVLFVSSEPAAAVGAPSCVPCPVGTYSAVASASTTCNRCAVGQTTKGVGARSKTACVCDAKQGFVMVSAGLCRNSSLLVK